MKIPQVWAMSKARKMGGSIHVLLKHEITDALGIKPRDLLVLSVKNGRVIMSKADVKAILRVKHQTIAAREAVNGR